MPPRPPNVSDQQIQQAVQRAATPAMIQQRIQQSGLAPAEIRARLQAAGYSPSLLDAYMGETPAAQAAGAPGADVNAALAALGMAPAAEAAAETPPETRPATPAAPPAPAGLQPFGSDLFARATSQFQPLLTGPVDPDYRLGPGDQLVLILTGDVELAHQLEVTREGFVVIPQVGQLWVNGLTLSQLTDMLYARLGRVYSGVKRGQGATTRFQVSISRLRMNQVFVIGEVNRPGAYQVPSVGTVFYALYLAGGPNGNGSYRDITVRRGERVIRTLDIYDYLLRGDNSNDIRLESGDVIFVPVRSRQVGIQGNIVRPALYELRPTDGLRQLVHLAGGVTPDAYLRRVQIDRVLPPAQRTEPGVDRVLLDVNVQTVLDSSRANVPLEPNDVVSVFAVLGERHNQVTIRGNVFRPGTYEFKSGMRLWDLIRDTRGLLSDTYLQRAHIVRLEPDLTRRLIPVALETDSAGTPIENPELADLDEVLIYAKSGLRSAPSVSISGSVRRPGRYPLVRATTLRDLVIAAGGLLPETYTGRAFISRLQPDSTRRIMPVALELDSLSLPFNADTLQDFDIIDIYGIAKFTDRYPVTIGGEVRDAHSESFQEGMTLRDLIVRAGGLRPTADLTVEIARLAEPRQRERGRVAQLLHLRVDSSYIVPSDAARFYLGHRDSLAAPRAADSARGFALRPWDFVTVRRLPDVTYQRVVTVSGEVRYPGRYALQTLSDRLADIIRRAGGLTASAYPKGAQFVRTQGDWGRVGIDLERALRSPGSRDNVILFAGDQITVPEYQPTVKVDGAVNSPVTVAYAPRRGVTYYIDHAGGFARQADKNRTYIVQPNGAVDPYSERVQPGARVVVPAVPAGEEKTNWASVLGAVATILTSALTIILVVQRL